MVNGPTAAKKHPLEACRLVVDTSFVAPQYQHAGDPLQTAPLDNPTASPRDRAKACCQQYLDYGSGCSMDDLDGPVHSLVARGLAYLPGDIGATCAP